MSNEIASLNIKNGGEFGLYQESEKDDTAVTLKFTDIILEDKSKIVGTYDRTKPGKTGVAFGSSVAPGSRSFSAGSSNVSYGDKSIALGCDNYCGGNQSIALGYANYSAGSSSVALGHCNISTGNGSFASGTETQAIGDASFTANTGTIAGGKYSAAFGNRTKALFDNQFVVGKFNDPTKLADGDLFVVGGGSADGDRCNAFVAGKTWQGDAYIRVGETTLSEETIKSLSGGGSANLTDYVKKTDYAHNNNAGVIRTHAYFGFNTNQSNGNLEIVCATNDEIKSKSQPHKPLVPNTLDYAVKVGLTTNTETLTDEEKAAAQSWLGITDLVGDIETALDELHNYAQALINGGAE